MKCIGSVLLVGVEGPCFAAIKQTWFTFILVLMVSIMLFQTLFARRAIAAAAAAALQILLFNLMSRKRLLETVELR